MARKSILRRLVAKASAPVRPAKAAPRRVASTEDLVERLLNAKSSNEIAAIAGLSPITGPSDSKVVY
ncbi:MAG TPA: hypothetical protein GXX24_12870 [Paracoccus solventivorans]|uniref:Uncharacterized protein n=1 Tax=Paracoccus solventivorans TaxID=53463 RepID=A0A832QXI6_9RHOB|nr:hypothetical protein [Paracoccus solventivorans]HHW35011.1 hypothetical protein [Paracoccus solventivorans]